MDTQLNESTNQNSLSPKVAKPTNKKTLGTNVINIMSNTIARLLVLKMLKAYHQKVSVVFAYIISTRCFN